MKKLLTLAALLAATLHISAKQQDVFMFGIATSFNDSIVYITDIQEVKGAYVEDTREKFLVNRDEYSYQLRNHCAELGHAHRTCTTFWATTRKDIEKKYNAMLDKLVPSQNPKKKKKRVQPRQIIYLTQDKFAYIAVEPDQGVTPAEPPTEKVRVK